MKRRDLWPGPGWRDLCVYRVVPAAEAAGFMLKPEAVDPGVADKHQSDEWQVHAIRFGDRRALVEYARVSGGIEGANRERRLSALLELRRGEWVRASGSAGDDAGYDELLGILGSVDAQ